MKIVKGGEIAARPQEKKPVSKEQARLVYSLILIFFIPVAIIVNFFWNVQKFQNNLESDLNQRAGLAAAIFAAGVSDAFDNKPLLQTKINALKGNSQIKEITILKPLDEGFEVIASSNRNEIGVIYSSLQYTTAWVENKNITAQGADKNVNPPARYNVVISPLLNAEGEQYALLNLKINLADIDALTQKALKENLIILIFTIFIVLLLLFNHLRFSEYMMLFRRLKEIDKMKDDFISMASHELKTPMTAIKGYMDMIFEGVAGKVDQNAKDHLLKVLGNIKRLDGLVDALLDVSRLEQQRMQFDMQAIDISTIIVNIVSELRRQAEEKKLKLQYQPPELPHPIIFADVDRLTQIFNNVIGNALKYTFKGGLVIFHRLEGDRLLTIIQDTGIGMSKDDMKGLFTKFYRIRNEKTVDIPGTGLGLWITKEIVIRMNGEIYASSKENLGSTFTISFPIIK